MVLDNDHKSSVQCCSTLFYGCSINRRYSNSIRVIHYHYVYLIDVCRTYKIRIKDRKCANCRVGDAVCVKCRVLFAVQFI